MSRENVEMVKRVERIFAAYNRRDWDEFEVEIEHIEIAPAADRAWVALRYRGKGKGSEIPVEGLFFQVSKWRDGKPFRAKEYTDRAEAREAAGLSE